MPPWRSDFRPGALLPGPEAGAHGDRVLAVTLQSLELVGQRRQLPGTAPADVSEILFRPEDIRITAAEEQTSLHGTVAAAFFLGDRTRLFVEVGETQPLVVESTARRDFAHGERVGLSIDPRGILIL